LFFIGFCSCVRLFFTVPRTPVNPCREGHLKKKGKKVESKAGQGLGLLVEKFLVLGVFVPIRTGKL